MQMFIRARVGIVFLFRLKARLPSAAARVFKRARDWRVHRALLGSAGLLAGGAGCGGSFAVLGAACAEEKKQQSKEEKKEEEEEEEQARTRDAIRQADDLYEQNKMVEALRLLERYGEEGSSNRSSRSNAEVLWRLARLCYKVGKYGTQDRAEAEQLSRAGMGFAERAVQCGDDNFACHKWMGILISWSSEFEGYKKKIERSFLIRDHFLKAIERNPKDATCHHLLGQWCYSVSSVPWYQQKVASVIFSTPPNSTYQEALRHFQAAEEVDPGFYSTNWLYIGKCHVQLGNHSEALVWLKKAAEYQCKFDEDVEAKEEAHELIKTL